jgi:DNA replication licensing factor MCM6
MIKIFSKLTPNETMDIKKIKENPKIYEEMAESLFPSIYGQR